jgi:hypothetical protein
MGTASLIPIVADYAKARPALTKKNGLVRKSGRQKPDGRTNAGLDFA